MCDRTLGKSRGRRIDDSPPRFTCLSARIDAGAVSPAHGPRAMRLGGNIFCKSADIGSAPVGPTGPKRVRTDMRTRDKITPLSANNNTHQIATNDRTDTHFVVGGVWQNRRVLR